MLKNTFNQFLVDSLQIFHQRSRLPKTANILALATAILAAVPICGFIHISIEPLFYACLLIDIIYLCVNGGVRFNIAFILFFLVIVINVLVVDIPSFFKPVRRAVLFMMLVTAVSSVLATSLGVAFRRMLFKYIVLILILLSVGSFFCFFLGVNMMSRRVLAMGDFDAYSTHGGWFGGLTVHSMMLGPISMLSALFFYILFLEKRKLLYIFLFFITSMSAVFASSRAALLGLAVAVSYSLIFGKFNAYMRRRMVRILFLCGILTLPIYETAFRGVINKNETRMSQTGSYNSREGKFKYRIDEFKSSPLLGVGFCAIDIYGGDAYSSEEGRVEPGSSHLSVLSMTGILGALVYAMIIFCAFDTARRIPNAYARYVLLCLIALFVHAWFEGYILSAGGFLALLYWLVVGQCIDCKCKKS